MEYCAERVQRTGLFLERCDNHESTPQHSHSYFEFVYVLHGRAIHSPFAYSLIREALMEHRGNTFPIKEDLYEWLQREGISPQKCLKICRVYAFLQYKSYCTDYTRYSREDMLLIGDYISEEQLKCLADKIEKQGKRICVVLFGIYRTLPQHHVWHYLLRNIRCVSMDFYSFALLFFDRELNPQYYKMRL